MGLLAPAGFMPVFDLNRVTIIARPDADSPVPETHHHHNPGSELSDLTERRFTSSLSSPPLVQA